MNRAWVVLLTVAVFLIGDRLGGQLLEHVLFRSQQRFPSLYEGRFDAEIVCIGNSRGVYALDMQMVEERTGRTVVNISHNGMTPRVANAIFADYLQHNRTPKILLIEITFATSPTSTSVVLDYKPFWSRSERLQQLSEEFSHTSVAATRWFHLYRYNSEIFLRALAYWLSGRSDQRGFMNKTITPDLLAETRHLEPFKLMIDPNEFEALKELIVTAQAKGVVVRPFVAPYLPTYAERITNLEDLITEVANATGLKVIDESQALTQTHLFADRLHVNKQGTQELTRLLIDAGVFDDEAAIVDSSEQSSSKSNSMSGIHHE